MTPICMMKVFFIFFIRLLFIGVGKNYENNFVAFLSLGDTQFPFWDFLTFEGCQIRENKAENESSEDDEDEALSDLVKSTFTQGLSSR